MFLAGHLCFAVWMCAYYSDPGPLRAWQARANLLLASLLVVCAANLYLVIKVIRSRKDHNLTG